MSCPLQIRLMLQNMKEKVCGKKTPEETETEPIVNGAEEMGFDAEP